MINEEDNFLNRILILIDIVKSELNKNVQGRLTTHDSRLTSQVLGAAARARNSSF